VLGVAVACGVFMREVVTFAVGALCFLVAGAVFTFEGGTMQKRTSRAREDSEKTPYKKRTAS
jgi:hypothetical protein